jgi:septation ring formation regulator EzrA
VSDNVLIALIDAAAMVLLLIAAYAIDRRAGSRRMTQSIDSLRDRVSGVESSLTAGVGAIVTRLQRLEEGVERLHEGQMDIRERLARLEGESAARKPTLWDPQEGAR